MRSFHVIIQRHNLPEGCAVETVELDGRSVLAVQLEPTDLNSPLTVSFDEALERLSELPRMFTEFDGSFVWVGQDGLNSWQLDGQLHDGATGLMDVELKGCVSQQSWNQLMTCLDWPVDQLVCQLVREGMFVGPAQFEMLIWPDGSS